MTRDSYSLTERITLHYADLTQNTRRLADYLLLNPEKVLIMSTNEIAEACSVSKTSVSRFIRRLGYADHLSLRNELLTVRESGQPVLTNYSENCDFYQEIKALERLRDQLNNIDTKAIINDLATAPRIKIIGYRNSYPLAMHFRQQLMQCRGNVELLPLPGQTIGEDLAAIEENDFVIVIGIRRRVSHFSKIIEQLQGNKFLLITDQSGQKYAQSTTYTLICHMNNEVPLDSYSVPMSLISHLVNSTYQVLKNEATKVSNKIANNYSKLNELE
ncbi:MurR/RpiR family transcriptional regulator [Psychromonas sp. RZ22]|uniref:MurR/RpiR family transcriptional regulator n=1 Tax=Psychromonas algarum TaxID=2555643 RepID=UPI001068C5C4|nr:MurR/RpiR family transcriptional regulator [Psychromonas sp. RZ22]TEW54458.1 MurR/RpiR family transcriptional regulator [Psychromonas sp. RZ22]